MKYILKKDLPFTKAGHKVEVNPSGCLPFVNYSTGVFSTTEEYVDKLISEGWIEEVKPRVGWLAEDEDGGYKFYLHPKPIIPNSWDKTSKWTEVIE